MVCIQVQMARGVINFLTKNLGLNKEFDHYEKLRWIVTAFRSSLPLTSSIWKSILELPFI